MMNVAFILYLVCMLHVQCSMRLASAWLALGASWCLIGFWYKYLLITEKTLKRPLSK